MALQTSLCRSFSCMNRHAVSHFAVISHFARSCLNRDLTQLGRNALHCSQRFLHRWNSIAGPNISAKKCNFFRRKVRNSVFRCTNFQLNFWPDTFQHRPPPQAQWLSHSSRYRIKMCHQKFRDTDQMSTSLATDRISSYAGLQRTRQKLQETKKKVARRMGAFKENIFTIPNGLCIFRIAATPVLGYLIISNNFVPALVLFGFAGISDVLDGFIARSFPSQQSMIGSFLDPFADKLLVVTLFGALTVSGLIPVPLTALIVARDVSLVAAASFIRYQSLPPPKTISRYFDVTFATAKLSPTLISKVNTFVQLAVVATAIGAPIFHYVDHPNIVGLWYLAAGTTVLSWMSYVFSKDTYKIFGAKYRQKKRT